MIQTKTVCAIWFFCATVLFNYETAAGCQKPDRADQAALLTDESFPEWRDRIRATEPELVWQNLPWTTSFHDGLRQAAVENKPLLLWVMNGHPMGCT